jgi:hypothetical protein
LQQWGDKRIKKEPTQAEVLTMIRDMVKLMAEGYSIVYARKQVCGGMKNKKTLALAKSDLYVHVLNKYMIERGYASRYQRQDDRIVCIRKEEWNE